MTLAAGTRLGPYEILHLAGAGGMGEVYCARDIRLDRTVAVKILPPELSADPARRTRFAREARVISQLSHPHICSLFDVGEADLPDYDPQRAGPARVDYLVMEYLAGETLMTHLRRGPLPLPQALRVAAQIAEGLGAAHKHGVVHRDLKPSNVMITKAGVKILDFGIAQTTDLSRADEPASALTTAALTGQGTVLGTRPYMAPEQLEGKTTDARTDLWAFGTILYEMVAGRPAFTAESAAALTAAILDREPVPLASIRPETPPALERIVHRCLAKDPDARWESARDLADELSWVAETSGTGGTPVVPASRSVRGPWRRRAGVAALFVLFTLAGAVVARWWTTDTGGRARTTTSQGIPVVTTAVSPVLKPRQLTSTSTWEAVPAISPDGSLVAYVSDTSGDPDIWVAGIGGTDALQLTDDPAVDGKPCWYPNGRTLAFVSDRGGQQAIWTVPVLGGSPSLLVSNASDPAIDPSGERVAFVRTGQGGTTRVSVASLRDPARATALTHADDGLWDHRDPAWSPDGKSIVYAAQRGLWVVPAVGGNARPLTTEDEADEEPVWSSDGRYVYFSSYREGTEAVWRLPVSGGAPERLTLGTGPEGHPSLSRDGRNIVYTTFSNNPDVVIRDLATGAEVALPNARSDYIPSFSRDGQMLLFVSDRHGGEFRVWLQPISKGRASGSARVLTDHAASHPTYSPDGRFVAYYRVGGGHPRNVWIMPIEGGAPIKLTDSTAESYHPAWSPRGTEIAFVSERDGTGRLMVVPVANGRPVGPERALTPTPGQYWGPAWSPDGSSVAYVVTNGDDGDVWTVRSAGTAAPRRVTSGAKVMRVKWHPREASLLVSVVGPDGVSLRRVSVAGGPLRPLSPPLRFGRSPELVDFDISRDGRWLTYSRESLAGDIWLAEVHGRSR